MRIQIELEGRPKAFAYNSIFQQDLPGSIPFDLLQNKLSPFFAS